MSRKLYWHFANESRRLGYDDGRKIKVGQKLTVDCEPVMCKRGLHASARLIDALSYAPGPVLCKVTLGGTVIRGDDKSVATERTVVAMADVTDILREFARKTAAEVWFKHFKRGQYPAVDLWLDHGGDDAAESAAWSVAWSAAESAALSAAGSVAWSVAWSAAESAALSAAAGSVAWSAAESAALSAAWSAAGSAARSAANKRLLRMVRRAAWETRH
jgi:hypothetical protein